MRHSKIFFASLIFYFEYIFKKVIFSAVFQAQMGRNYPGYLFVSDRKMQDYEKQIEAFYGKIEGIEIAIAELEQRRTSIRRQAITVDNIYKYLIYFDTVYAGLSDDDKRNILENLIEAVHIYPEQQSNGQILKRIDFKLPIVYNEEKVEALCWDKDGHVETVVLMSRQDK